MKVHLSFTITFGEIISVQVLASLFITVALEHSVAFISVYSLGYCSTHNTEIHSLVYEH